MGGCGRTLELREAFAAYQAIRRRAETVDYGMDIKPASFHQRVLFDLVGCPGELFLVESPLHLLGDIMPRWVSGEDFDGQLHAVVSAGRPFPALLEDSENIRAAIGRDL